MNQSKASEKEPADEEILFPESELTIRGEKITVNEVTYQQGMRIHAAIAPMLDAMAAAFSEERSDFSVMAGVFAEHADVVDQLLLLTTGKDSDWLASLSDEEGQLVLMTFWMVNSGFFTRRLVMKSMAKLQEKTKNQ